MTLKNTDLQTIAKGLAPVLKAHLGKLERRIAKLESQLSAQTDVMKYQGVHHRMARYKRGDVVIDKDVLWICTKDGMQDSKPGADSGWTPIAESRER